MASLNTLREQLPCRCAFNFVTLVVIVMFSGKMNKKVVLLERKYFALKQSILNQHKQDEHTW